MSNCISCKLDTTPLPKSGADCGIVNEDPLYSTGDCALDANGNPIVTPTPTVPGSNPCVVQANGLICPDIPNCTPFDLTTEQMESCIAGSVIGESISIGGAPMKVYKLLGVHEQTKLVDQVGTGTAFSNGDMPNFPSSNAFDKLITEWRSLQIGTDVVKSAFIGYDFGPIRLDNGRLRYGIETAIKKDVTSFRFKQGCEPGNRVTSARLERSNDGVKWFGVKALSLPDCDGLVTINVPRTVPSRYWRLRPTTFKGGVNDYWVVQAFQLIDYEITALNNIQDRILLENRDRDYQETPVNMKCAYTVTDVIANQTKWGFMPENDSLSLEVSFTQTVAALGRPFVIGDLIDLIPETQYSANLTPIRKMFMVDDVGWSVNGFTAGWVPTMQRLIVRPAVASQETQDVMGKLATKIDSTGLVDIDGGFNPNYQDFAGISQTVKADANTMVPERGEDDADITKFSKTLTQFSDAHPHMNIRKQDKHKNTMYSYDAMPPNGAPYTQGETWPANPSHGDYHRLTYDSVGKGIPARLFRYSSKKGHWLLMAIDERFKYNNTKPRLQEFLDPSRASVTPIDKVDDSI